MEILEFSTSRADWVSGTSKHVGGARAALFGARTPAVQITTKIRRVAHKANLLKFRERDRHLYLHLPIPSRRIRALT